VTATLQDIQDAWVNDETHTRDEALTRSLADEYVAAHPEEFTELATLSVEELVQAVDVFRAANLTQSQYRVEAWLWHHFEPQTIGGSAQPQIRLSEGS
jgi:hypothetical protein